MVHLGLVVLLLAGAISVNANGRTIFVGFTERQYSVDEGSRSVRVCVTLSLSSVETIGSDRVWLEVVPDNNPTNVPAGVTPATADGINPLGSYNNDRECDYKPPVEGIGQIAGTSLSHATPTLCYDQLLCNDDARVEGDEFFGLGLVVQSKTNVEVLVENTTVIIIDNDGSTPTTSFTEAPTQPITSSGATQFPPKPNGTTDQVPTKPTTPTQSPASDSTNTSSPTEAPTNPTKPTNDTTDPLTKPTKPTNCTSSKPPTPEPPTCPEPEPCDSCCGECTCPPPFTCQPCPTCRPCPTPSTPTGPLCLPVPGNVENVRRVNCSSIEWDAPEDVEGCVEQLIYKIRFFSGETFASSSRLQRVTIMSSKTSLSFTVDDMPVIGGPIHTTVKARNSESIYSSVWSNRIQVKGDEDCP